MERSSLAEMEKALKAVSDTLKALMERNGPSTQTYKEALLRPARVKVPVAGKQRQYWRKVSETDRPVRSDLVRSRIEELKRLSSPTHPICFRCGDHGHRANQCRNAILCFACNRLGHRSPQCGSVTVIAPKPLVSQSIASTTQIGQPPHHSTLPTKPLPFSKSTLPTKPSQSTSNTQSMAPMHPPVPTFHASPDTEFLEAAFKRSFILLDEAQWGPEKVEHLMKLTFPLYPEVRVLEEYKYIIESPSQTWLSSNLEKGHILLENKEVSILPWDPAYIEGMQMIPVWVRVYGFPMMLWKW